MEGVSYHYPVSSAGGNKQLSQCKSFSVMYFNCRSILPKSDELAALCAANNPDAVCLVETWLSDDVLDNEIFIPNYSIVRLDRNRHGGGVAIYIHCTITYNVLLCGPAGLELLVVSLLRNHFKLCLSVFYRPPSSPSSIFDTLCDALLSVDSSYFSNFVILGDFNANFVTSHYLYTEFMASFSLSQVVDSPTHFSSSGQPSTIDLVFVSNLHYLSNCSVIPQLANSDHLGLLVAMQHHHHPATSACRRRIWLYKHANFERANDLLCDIDPNDILIPSDIQLSWSHFKAAFLSVMEQCIPQTVLPDRKNLPWLSKEIIQLIRKRNRYFRQAHSSGNSDDHLKFKQLRNKVVAKLRHAKHEFFSKLQPSNPKVFWKVVKLLNFTENALPTLISDNITATTNLDKANLLNATFASNFNSVLPGPTLDDIPSECPIEFLCTEDEVYGLLSTLDTTKANGHDDISAKMLKETALSITPVITELFNLSIRLCELPDEWKIARVSPIPKPGSHSDPRNYRPISLLSILSKLLEKHICKLLTRHFEEHHPISAQQWGFTQGKSTTGALLDATDQWFRWMEQGHDVCTVFFDFSKAFDSVPHRHLLNKLQNYNVHPQILRWITHYLSMRSQYVCVHGTSSDILPVSSGVPQGSVLGPLLFIIYIDDITTVPLSDGSMTIFADDITLYRPIYTAADYDLVQTDIDSLCSWTDNNLLRLNAIKCKYMIISRKKQPSIPGSPLTVNHSQLDRVSSYKYLGVWLTSSLNWSMQVASVCKRARQEIGIIYRRFYRHTNCSTLLKLYLAFVRPHLEYAAPVWDPHQLGHIHSIERVQKFALKVCSKRWNEDYDHLCNLFNLPTLSDRRRYLKLCFLYQIIHSSHESPIVRRSMPTQNLRNHSPFLYHRPAAHTNAYYYSFFPHSVALWNSLPPSVHASNSLSSFKHALSHSPIL